MEGSAADRHEMLPILGADETAAEGTGPPNSACVPLPTHRDGAEDLDRTNGCNAPGRLRTLRTGRGRPRGPRPVARTGPESLVRTSGAGRRAHYEAAAAGVPMLAPASQAASAHPYHEVLGPRRGGPVGMTVVRRSVVPNGGGPPVACGADDRPATRSPSPRGQPYVDRRSAVHARLRLHDNRPSCRMSLGGAWCAVRGRPGHRAPHRRRFLLESLHDLRTALRRCGADLVMRHGDPVTETVAVARAVGASRVDLAADVSRYARDRQRRLTDAASAHRTAVTAHDGVTIVPPGALRPAGGDHYRVFTRTVAACRLSAPGRAARSAAHPVPMGSIRSPAQPSVPDGRPGRFGRPKRGAWLRRVTGTPDRTCRPDATSRLSRIYFGCVSPRSVVRDRGRRSSASCVARLYHPLLAGFRPCREPTGRKRAMARRPGALAALCGGPPSPIVDAGHAPAGRRGFMPNRPVSSRSFCPSGCA